MSDSERKLFDPFQKAWEGPEAAHALFVDNEHGYMVIPDAKPVVRHHLLVVGRQPVHYNELWIRSSM